MLTLHTTRDPAIPRRQQARPSELVLIGLEAWQTSRLQEATPWMQRYRWPIRFFVAVSFWNFLGAGVFGFLINPPLALYYMQGLNTTPVHAHTALFGVYGLLSLGLMLIVARLLTLGAEWRSVPWPSASGP